MRLVQIEATGAPAEPVGSLPANAGEIGPGYAGLYRAVGYQPPWTGYFALIEGVCVGTCGFKAPPVEGRVEIAYYTFPAFEGGGIATQMACMLVEIARCADPGLIVAAQTLPQRSASTAILRKLGFENRGSVMHPEDGEVWEWQLK